LEEIIGLLHYWRFGLGVKFQLNSLKSRVAVAGARGQFGNPEEGECPPLKPITRGMVKKQQNETTVYVL
jgi:hypothetical protein